MGEAATARTAAPCRCCRLALDDEDEEPERLESNTSQGRRATCPLTRTVTVLPLPPSPRSDDDDDDERQGGSSKCTRGERHPARRCIRPPTTAAAPPLTTSPLHHLSTPPPLHFITSPPPPRCTQNYTHESRTASRAPRVKHVGRRSRVGREGEEEELLPPAPVFTAHIQDYPSAAPSNAECHTCISRPPPPDHTPVVAYSVHNWVSSPTPAPPRDPLHHPRCEAASVEYSSPGIPLAACITSPFRYHPNTAWWAQSPATAPNARPLSAHTSPQRDYDRQRDEDQGSAAQVDVVSNGESDEGGSTGDPCCCCCCSASLPE
ncbi:hypothetical protein GALMADRAFT_139796 [Galerina marginata CBS 339.88]|uniref:Uncharacterized protein n=1 Tax=Galerina marginata (strain CBS 339.88) TaxID=685588 RepID=A0A067T162_GALM3|nr:hypothetical protein GALMADRAFT_139796 [Galerina marginata CBS 339.88]